MKLNKFVCLFVCLFVCHRSKKHFLYVFTFTFNVEKIWSWLGSKVKKTLFPSGFKGQKNIFDDFLLSCRLVEKAWSWSGSKVKKYFFLPGSKVKKTFSRIFQFLAHQSKKHGLDWDQKSTNIFSFWVQRSKKHFQ